MRSVPSTTERLSGEAATSIGKHFAGRRLAGRGSALRSASSPRWGRVSWGTPSHLGPPTAPKRIACARRHSSSAPGASGAPVASIAAPPTSASSNSNPTPAALPTARRTRTASGVTSWPMPSPGRTAIRYVAIRVSLLGADFLRPLRRRLRHPVERREVRPRARLDDVRGRALAGHERAVEVHLHRDLADRVLARRRGVERVILQTALEPGDGVDRGEHRVHGAVAHARVLEDLPLPLELHRRRRHDPGAADDVEVLELVQRAAGAGGLGGHDRHQVLVVDLLLAVREILERLEGPVEVSAREVEAQVLEPGRERVAPRVLAQDELVRGAPDVLGPHDLVRELLLEHAVLVDPGLVRERVLADDRLVGLDVDAGDVGEQARALEDLLGPDPRVHAEEVLARAEGHHDLLQGGVAGPLADPVDRALDLPRAVHDRGERVRHRLAQIVVAVDREDDLLDPAHALADAGDALTPLAGDRVADGVGDVDGARAGLDHRREHVAHVVEVRA